MKSHSSVGSARPGPRLVPVADGASPRRQKGLRALVEQRLACERPRHLRYLVARLRSRDDAEDVLQDFTVKALQGAGRIHEDRVDAWLGVSLRNALFDRYRRDGARKRLIEAAAAEPLPADDPEEAAEAPLNCLAESIAQLKDSYATVLRRAELEEASLKTVAEELGLTANNAAVRVHRAREALRQAMLARCSACLDRCPLAARFIATAA